MTTNQRFEFENKIDESQNNFRYKIKLCDPINFILVFQ